MDSIRKVFAYRLRELRGAMTQDEFSEKLGISKSGYQKMEAGSVPQKDTLKQLARKLGLPSETPLFQDPDLGSRSAPPADPLAASLKVISDLLELLTTGDQDQRAGVLSQLESLVHGYRKLAGPKLSEKSRKSSS